MYDLKKTQSRQRWEPNYGVSYIHSGASGRPTVRNAGAASTQASQTVYKGTQSASVFRLVFRIGKHRVILSTAPFAMLLARLDFLLPRDKRIRLTMGVGVVVIVAAEIIRVLQPYVNQEAYALGAADALLQPISQPMAEKIKYDPKQAVYNFNSGYSASTPGMLGSTGSQASAAVYQDAAKGITITDPVNSVDL